MTTSNGRQSGQGPPAPPAPPPPGRSGSDQPYRVPDEVIRHRVRELARVMSFEDLAVRAGVSRSTVDSVVKGVPFSPELRKRWRDWYRADVAAEPVLETDAEAAALLLHHVVVPAFGDEWRRGARDIAARLERLARARGPVVPGWIPVVGAAAESGELPPRPDRAGVRRLTRSKKRKAGREAAEGSDGGGEPS